MNSDHPISIELRTLVEAAFDDCLDDSQRTRLDELLASDPDACLSYVQYMSTLVGLRRYLVGRPAFVGDIEKSAPETAEEPNLPSKEMLAGKPEVATPSPTREKTHPSPLGFITDCFSPEPKTPSRIWLLTMVMGVSTLAALLFVVMLQNNAVPNSTTPQIANRNSPSIAGSLTDAALSNSGINSLRLASGTAKFWIAGVGWVVAEGPADFDLLSPMRARLNRGRITVRVTEPSGHGFIVETPDGNVTDLGTEFGLDVSAGNKTSLLVFEGAVDLSLPSEQGLAERLVGGEGVDFSRHGEKVRVPCVVRGSVATFLRVGESRSDSLSPLITDVSDNLESQTKRFYEIVPGGFKNDTPVYVDRLYQWKRFSNRDEVRHLIGADYVKTFNDDKLQTKAQINVTLAKPAKLYVLFDRRVKVPEWLQKDFRKLGGAIGMKGVHEGRVNVCSFDVWERTVRKPGVVILGPCNEGSATHDHTSMYAIAAAPLPEAKAPKPSGKKPSMTKSSKKR